MTTLTRPNDFLDNETVREEPHHLKEYRESVFENAPVMMHSIDENGRLVKVNRLWRKWLGYENSEVLGLRSIDLLTEESRARALKDTLPLFWRTGSARSIGYTFVTKAGAHVDLLLDAVKCPGAMGTCSTFAALRDPHSFLQWRQASATLQALLELADLPVAVAHGSKPELTSTPDFVDPGSERPPAGTLASESMIGESLSRLTGRELEILQSLASGNRNKEIAEQLSLAVRTVRFHIENLYRKLEVNSRTQAVRVAFERGYLKPIYWN